MKNNTKIKFLVIRFSSIGDIVLTSPVVRLLKQQVANAEVHFLTKKQYATTLIHNPHIDHLHLLDNNLSELINRFRHEKFDYIIDLHNNLRSWRVRFSLRLRTFSFNKLNWKKWLLVNFKIDKMPKLHIVDRYLETIQLFDIQNDSKGLDYFIAADEQLKLNELPTDFQQGYIAFVIGAQHFSKRLPNHKIASICLKINRPIVLLGGKDDKKNAQEIIKKIETKNPKIPIFDACGKYSLNRSASLVQQAQLVISHDTGLMHIAAAFRKKIISIWGSTVPQFGMSPYLPDPPASEIFEVKLKCRPCSKIGFSACPKKHFNCMNLIDETQIAQTIQKHFI